MLYTSHESIFTSIQFLVLNLDADLMYFLSFFFLFFDIPSLCYYINLTSSIVLVFLLEIYVLFFSYFFTMHIFNCLQIVFCEGFAIFVILPAILLPVKSPAELQNCFLSCSFCASEADCLSWSRSFWLYLSIKFLLTFLPIYLLIYLPRDKNP